MFRWGFINCFRVDNGAPFGEPTRQALSPLHLRLCAAGLRVHLNPARSPKSNAKVERAQGTTARWADPARCADHIELQQQLDLAVEAQREMLHTRACGGMTRSGKYPSLMANPKRFHPDDFQIKRVHRLLAMGTWQRKVSANGTTEVFGLRCQVGNKHRGKEVEVKFNPKKSTWRFLAKNGQVLNEIRAKNLTYRNILALSFCQ